MPITLEEVRKIDVLLPHIDRFNLSAIDLHTVGTPGSGAPSTLKPNARPHFGKVTNISSVKGIPIM